MQFVVRDLARESGKQIKLELLGRETEIDKFLVERMTDPLMHLVRNAVSHGLETADERVAQGKPAEGKLTLRAATVGESVLIEIADDGRGIDKERVAARAETKGLLAAGAQLDDAALLELICAPGFSTRDEADRGSGRGVGMDVVRNTVQELGGRISLETESGRGTRFTIELPLTLAIAEALIVSVDGQRFAVPQSAVQEVLEVESSTVKALENNEIIAYRGGVLPLVRLARFFELHDGREQSAFHVFVIGSGANALGVAVDRIIGQREIVVRGISDPLVQVAGIAGATELGDEQVVLILDVAALRQSTVSR
jgi:two-component system chemotaxis sensor kinase CheA